MKIRDRIKSLRRVSASQLLPNPKNWRKHPDAQQDAMRGVLSEIGFADAVLARETAAGLMLIDGHLRADIAPDSKIPVLVLDVTEEEADKILATHDPIAEMATADQEKFAELMASISFESEATQNMCDSLNRGAEQPPEEDVAPVEKADELLKKWRVAVGDVWCIEGQQTHRLCCGDSTKFDAVSRLLHGSCPYIMVTDPPYGVKYDPNWRNDAAKSGHISYADRRIGDVSNDDQLDWSAAYAHFPGGVAYVWHADRFASEVASQLENINFQIRCQIIWNKSRFAISRGHYHWQHEPCWYAVKSGMSANWIGDRSQTTVWDISPTTQDSENLTHSTQKPVECMARAIRNHQADVYDPFVGSGTTISACEQLGRRCFAMELEPKYVAVCLERMEKLGCKCKKASDSNGKARTKNGANKAEGAKGSIRKRPAKKKQGRAATA